MSIYDSLPKEQKDLIAEHLRLVIKANEHMNLTRITDWDEAILLHVEDSLSAWKELDEAPRGLYGDLGSGAGYPGIPLAIVSGRKTVLIDSRQKKMAALSHIVEQMGLSGQVSTYAGRAELLARTQSKRYAALTARALAKLSVLMELASPLLMKGGKLICYKANVDEAELAHARRVQQATGMAYRDTREFQLGENFLRKIIVFEKTANATVKLPRLEGQAQKNPL